ncbi:hypothetical protein F511_31714 [Dorcoceras hygrometricum]|uniref:Histone acetyltransferase n=1 Tax=Dorcoceras hygrometricum TaxID=472368 RepID=A0A2Z7ABY6_9LAMI|nr:hypothetical protein F511_31714 [Dorcoceras hygrometricum]
MPRPGPRPYECVKRAWHSDRHQPLRGLIIQQIFRLVHENHCGGTKKNREWLEKLPVVVLKSEEIMYSKANSEAEYSNLETLWDRVNEAIDTIIRKEESKETGGLLPPCVEAALNLGCVPVRASRSQRNKNPRSYLGARNQEPFDLSPNVSNTHATEHHSVQIPPRTAELSMFNKLPNVDSPRLVSESNKCLTVDTNKGVASSCERLPCIGNNWCTELGSNNSLNIGSVYPLHYTNFETQQASQLCFQEPRKSDAIIFGVPIFPSVAKPAEIGTLQNLFPYAADSGLTHRSLQSDPKNSKGKEPQTACDLSLRLGRFSGSNPTRENNPGCGTDSVVCRVSQVEDRPIFKEFHFFPVESTLARDPSMQSRGNRSYEVENPEGEEVARKRKLAVSGDADQELCFWSQDYISNQFDGRMKRPAL